MCCKETYTSRASENIIYENEKIKYRNMIKPYKIKQILIKYNYTQKISMNIININYKAKYKLIVSKCKIVGLNHCNNPKAFNDY